MPIPEPQIDITERILDDILNCRKDCGSNFKPKVLKLSYADAIDYLIHNLPTLPFVMSQTINYIFSDGLVTGSDTADEKLDKFLYSENIQGVTNISVLQQGIKEAILYGKNGIRWLSEKDGIINIDSRYYGAILQENTEYYGFKDVVAYIISIKRRPVENLKLSEIDFDVEEMLRKGVIVDKDRNILIVSPDEFMNLRQNPTRLNGESSLSFDKQRLQLLATLYERLNYDVEYDGPGRIILRLREGFEKETDTATSTTDIVDNTIANQRDRSKKIKKEIEGVATQVMESKSDNVIVLSPVFSDKVEHLPRVTKTTEFLTYMQEYEGVIISQMIGVPPALYGLGKQSGNISMEKIIDNAMLNAIIPMREKFATQISAFLSPKLGLPKIYFDKYNMAQSADENDARAKVVDMIVKLKDAEEPELAQKFVEMLDNDLGPMARLKTLSSTFISKVKKLFNRKRRDKNVRETQNDRQDL